VSLSTVLLWRSRFADHVVDHLVDAPHPSRPRLYEREARENIVAETLIEPAGSVTHWSRLGCVEDVITAIKELANAWDDHAAPVAWVMTADRILAKAVEDPRTNSGAVRLQRMADGPARLVAPFDPGRYVNALGPDPMLVSCPPLLRCARAAARRVRTVERRT
jgi:hypothetical protein